MCQTSKPDAERHNPNSVYIGELIRLSMERNSITSQAAIAKRLGVGHSTLKDWKSGKHPPMYAFQYALEGLAGITY